MSSATNCYPDLQVVNPQFASVLYEKEAIQQLYEAHRTSNPVDDVRNLNYSLLSTSNPRNRRTSAWLSSERHLCSKRDCHTLTSSGSYPIALHASVHSHPLQLEPETTLFLIILKGCKVTQSKLYRNRFLRSRVMNAFP